jgi:hypothetical protein
MRKSVWITFLLLLTPALSRAQVEEDLRRQGYVFAAPGAFVYEGAATTFELGGGMEWLVHRGLSFGFDASLMGFRECFSCVSMALGSVDAAYHFIPSGGRLVPFVLGGIGGIAIDGGAAVLGNVGGGFNYWFENGMALRVEVRDRFHTDGVHLVGVRVGVTF